jgi:tetratricopeptide (TPR) repeat protein
MTDTAALEEERDFLLRSLDDLEAEREAGNIDDETYRSLHDDYTARAASVLRSLRDGSESELPGPPRMPRRNKVIVALVLVAFAGVTAFGLTRALGSRSPGDTITGNSEVNRPDEVDDGELAALAAAAAASPQSYDARIAYARMLLGTDLARALREFDAASQLDPDQPEPWTYIGWINALAARALQSGPDRDNLIRAAQESLDRALALDPEYEDAYVYRALFADQVIGDPASAIPDYQRFLALAPADHPMRELVTGALSEAIPGTSTTVPSP